MNKTYVSAGKPKVTGAVYAAAAGTTVPTDSSTALAAAFKELGYVSEDGVTNSNSPETEEVKAWGGDIVLMPQTRPDKWKFKLIECQNAEVLKVVYGDTNVTPITPTGTNTVPGATIAANAKQLEEHVYVIETVMRSGSAKRIVIPCGIVTSVSDIEYGDSDAVGYEIEITALPDSSGNTHYEYISDAA